MPIFPRTTALAWWLLGPGLGLLPACSPDSPAHPPATAAPPPAPAARSVGARADSLNGIPGHHFGEPLSAFPGLRRVPTDPGGYDVYAYAADSRADQTWFGRHRAQLSTVRYLFLDGQFAGLQVAQPKPANELGAETIFLLGHGRGYGDHVSWDGQRVVASWTANTSFTGQALQWLEILSKPAQARLQQRTQQRLQAENK